MAYGAISGKGEINDHDLGALIENEIKAAVNYDQTELSAKRTRAIEYMRGEMNDTPSRPNGSTVTSRDLADTISWMLPGIMRVFMAADRMVEYRPVAAGVSQEQYNAYRAKQKQPPQPVGNITKEETEAIAKDNADQASDYISYVFMEENDGYRVVYNATHDSLLSGNGIVKHTWDDTPECEYSGHSRLTVEQVAALTAEEGVEVQAQEKNPEPDMVQDPMTGQPMPVETYNIKIKREINRGRLRITAIATEDLLLDDGAATLDDFRFIAQHDPNMTRSRLVEMGFDKDKIDGLPADPAFIRRTEMATARFGDRTEWGNTLIRSMEVIDYYECYLKIDVDGDGVAETVQVHYAGSAGAGEVLDWSVWEDDVPFSDIPCYPKPHRFDAESVADRTMDIQQVKTVLQRQGLENLYASNLPMKEVEEGSVLNPDILVSPKFGATIWKKRGSTPIVPHVIPFVADKVFSATEYFDRIMEKRTGVSRTSMALDPEALQNQTATANQNAKDAAYSQNELVARNMAELGWKRVFRQLLRLIVKHQDRPRMIQLRGKFVEMDPRHWNANMDVTVNTGLGTGSRDRDMAMLQTVAANQIATLDRLAQAGFRSEAIDMIPRLRLTFVKQAESAGIKNPDMFYPEFDERKLAQLHQQADQMAQQPPLPIQIEQAKAQGAAQLKTIEAQTQQQADMGKVAAQKEIEGIKAQGNQVKEMAQLQGDLAKAQADREAAGALQREKIASDERIAAAEIASRERIAEMQMIEKQMQGMAAEDGKADGGNGTAKPKAKANPAMHPMAKMIEQMSQAVTALAQAHGAPKRVVRDPQTNAVIGVETVLQ